MAKTKITYNGESESVEWHGQAFERGKAIETDNEALIDAARRNPLFATAGLADKQTAAEVKAEEAARKEAEKRAEEEAREEAARVLERNAAYAGDDEPEGDEGSEGEANAAPAAPRRGRPRKS